MYMRQDIAQMSHDDNDYDNTFCRHKCATIAIPQLIQICHTLSTNQTLLCIILTFWTFSSIDLSH